MMAKLNVGITRESPLQVLVLVRVVAIVKIYLSTMANDTTLDYPSPRITGTGATHVSPSYSHL
jgi:hypothetical protein